MTQPTVQTNYFPRTAHAIWVWMLVVSVPLVFVTLQDQYIPYLTSMRGIIDKTGGHLGRDFIVFWTATAMLKAGNAEHIYSFTAYRDALRILFHPYRELYWAYPPQFLFFLQPFTYIASYKIAYLAWCLSGLLALAAALCWRETKTIAWQRAIIFLAPSLMLCIYDGQNALLVAALLVAGFRLLGPAPLWAGVMFALLAFKPQFGLLIPFVLLALRQYRAFKAAALTLAVLVFLSGWVFGWQAWGNFFYNGWTYQTQALHRAPGMISVYVAMLWAPLTLAAIAQLLVSIIVALLLCMRLRQMQDAHWSEWLLLTTPALYLATPYAWNYDLCALSAAWVVWLSLRKETISPLLTLSWLTLWFISPFWGKPLLIMGLPVTPVVMIAAFIAAWQQTAPAVSMVGSRS